KERHLSFAGHRPGQQRLPRSRGADQQHATRNAGTERMILLGLTQKVDFFLQLRFGFIGSSHIGKGDLGMIACIPVGLRAPKAEYPCLIGAGLAPHPDKKPTSRSRGKLSRSRVSNQGWVDAVLVISTLWLSSRGSRLASPSASGKIVRKAM